MKKYITPEVKIVRFDVGSVVMTGAPTPTPTGIMMSDMNSGLTTVSTNAYIPQDIEQKAWTSVDGNNWAWEDVK